MAMEWVDDFPFGDDMSEAKLSTITWTKLEREVDKPGSVCSKVVALVAECLKRHTSS